MIAIYTAAYKVLLVVHYDAQDVLINYSNQLVAFSIFLPENYSGSLINLQKLVQYLWRTPEIYKFELEHFQQHL